MKTKKMINLINDISKGFFKRSYTQSLRNKICIICGDKVNLDNSFRDKISKQEYIISGLCQKCQDKTFI